MCRIIGINTYTIRAISVGMQCMTKGCKYYLESWPYYASVPFSFTRDLTALIPLSVTVLKFQALLNLHWLDVQDVPMYRVFHLYAHIHHQCWIIGGKWRSFTVQLTMGIIAKGPVQIHKYTLIGKHIQWHVNRCRASPTCIRSCASVRTHEALEKLGVPVAGTWVMLCQCAGCPVSVQDALSVWCGRSAAQVTSAISCSAWKALIITWPHQLWAFLSIQVTRYTLECTWCSYYFAAIAARVIGHLSFMVVGFGHIYLMPWSAEWPV